MSGTVKVKDGILIQAGGKVSTSGKDTHPATAFADGPVGSPQSFWDDLSVPGVSELWTP